MTDDKTELHLFHSADPESHYETIEAAANAALDAAEREEPGLFGDKCPDAVRGLMKHGYMIAVTDMVTGRLFGESR